MAPNHCVPHSELRPCLQKVWTGLFQSRFKLKTKVCLYFIQWRSTQSISKYCGSYLQTTTFFYIIVFTQHFSGAPQNLAPGSIAPPPPLLYPTPLLLSKYIFMCLYVLRHRKCLICYDSVGRRPRIKSGSTPLLANQGRKQKHQYFTTILKSRIFF